MAPRRLSPPALYREIDIKDLGAFLDGVFVTCLPHVEPDAAVYVWHAHVHQPTIAAAFERHGLLLHQILVWVKPCATFGHCYYRWGHEPCAFGWRRGNMPKHGHGALDTVWEFDWEGKARITTFHPTSRPPRVFEITMEQHTKGGDVILEPFSGSGSQIIAAEKFGGRCFAMEIAPAFVDGTVKRWEATTGKKATLESEGKSFAEIAAERGVPPQTRQVSSLHVRMTTGSAFTFSFEQTHSLLLWRSFFPPRSVALPRSTGHSGDP